MLTLHFGWLCVYRNIRDLLMIIIFLWCRTWSSWSPELHRDSGYLLAGQLAGACGQKRYHYRWDSRPPGWTHLLPMARPLVCPLHLCHTEMHFIDTHMIDKLSTLYICSRHLYLRWQTFMRVWSSWGLKTLSNHCADPGICSDNSNF